MSRSRLAVTVATCLLITLCSQTTVFSADLLVRGTVIEVYDGDTITIKADGTRFKCRLLGIDAPEMSYKRLWTEMDKVSKYAPLEARRELYEAQKVFRKWAKVMEGHAREARNAPAGMVKGKTVRLEYDSREPTRDRYGRLLVYVSLDGTDVNAELIRCGLAVADTRFSCDRLNEYVKLWRAAQAAHVGLWGLSAKGGL